MAKSPADKAARQRQALLNKLLAERTAQARNLAASIGSDAQSRMNAVRAQLGAYGTLSSGPGARLLFDANQEGLSRAAQAATDLNVDLLRSQLSAGQFDDESARAWEQMRGSQAAEASRIALQRELADKDAANRLALQEGQQRWQTGESGLSREHELAMQLGTQQFQGQQSALSREQEKAILAAQQQFQGGQAALGRQHEVALQQGSQAFQSAQGAAAREQEKAILAAQQQFQGQQSALGREQEAALQQGRQQWQSGESALERQQQARLQAGQQQFQGGQAALSREQEKAMAVLQGQVARENLGTEYGLRGQENAANRAFQASESAASRQFQGQESALDRELKATQFERQQAMQEKELAMQQYNAEANRGVQRDQMAMNKALEEARLADARQVAAWNHEIQLSQLAETIRAGKASDMYRAGSLLSSGMNPNNPIGQQILGSTGLDTSALTGGSQPSGASRGWAGPQAGPASDRERQLADMSAYWANQQQAANNSNPVFYPQSTGRYVQEDTPLDYYRAATQRMALLDNMRGNVTGANPTAGGGWIPDEQRRNVAQVMNWVGSGRVPNTSRENIAAGIQAGITSGMLSQQQAAALIDQMGGWGSRDSRGTTPSYDPRMRGYGRSTALVGPPQF